MDTSSRSEYEGEACQLLFDPVAERTPRRLSKAESLSYVRTIRARLHRADDKGAEAFGPTEQAGTEHRRVA